MNRKIICASLMPTLFLFACERAPTPPDAPPAAPSTRHATNTSSGNHVAGQAAAPPILTPQAERGIEGARNVMLSFARFIEQQRYDQAWSLLSPGDQQKWSKQEFAASFAGLKDITVAIPTGTTDGAAGSIYYTAPITITATDEDGCPIRMEGEAVLRRVNDVDGATPAQLRWHFDALRLGREG